MGRYMSNYRKRTFTGRIDYHKLFSAIRLHTEFQYNVYLLYLKDELIYIGKSLSIENRLKKHYTDRKFDKIKILKFDRESDMHIVEVFLINKLNPLNNRDSCSRDIDSPTVNLIYQPNAILTIDESVCTYDTV